MHFPDARFSLSSGGSAAAAVRDPCGEESMQVRRAAPGDAADDSTAGDWRGRSPRTAPWFRAAQPGRAARMAPWFRAALPGRAARAGADALALAVALLVATLLRHDGQFAQVE